MAAVREQPESYSRVSTVQTGRSLGASYNQMDLVLHREDGSPLDRTTLYTSFRKLLQRAGLPPVSLHELRRSHATLLLAKGVSAKAISERLGHKDVAFTMRVYAHLLETIQQEAADQTDDLLRRATARDTVSEASGDSEV